MSIYRPKCKSSFFEAKLPYVGDSVDYPNCESTGYGTYDSLGYYILEWYEEDTPKILRKTGL